MSLEKCIIAKILRNIRDSNMDNVVIIVHYERCVSLVDLKMTGHYQSRSLSKQSTTLGK
jgi:hypothetical protein